MSIIEGVVVGAETGGFYTTEIEQSLRFDSASSSCLSWTPASTGNRKTWTFSTWVKTSDVTTQYRGIFHAGTSTGIMFSNERLELGGYAGVWWQLRTNALFRDPSAWYHVVVKYDSTQSIESDRVKLYVNGELQTSLYGTTTYPTQNSDGNISSSNAVHTLGVRSIGGDTIGGYLAETHFIDGTAYDATAFGEFKNGVWIPKTVSVTYGSNGFYLPYRNDYTVEGFSTVTYQGNGSTQYIGGVGFEPDLVWLKQRSGTEYHHLVDSIRGTGVTLFSNTTGADYSSSTRITGLESDGFTVGSDTGTNANGGSYVAWCWDAGTGSPVSNTDGSITSTVKANPSRGFSVADFTFQTSGTATIGHGLTSAPEMVIVKGRNWAGNWHVWHTGMASGTYNAMLNSTAAASDSSAIFSAAPTSSVVNLGSSWGFGSGNTGIMYCFHSVSGYSKMGSYTGTGASGNAVTTGFKPAFVMVKRTDSANNWAMFDSTRSPADNADEHLLADLSDAAYTDIDIDFTATGFEINNTGGTVNASGGTYIYMAFADTREAAFWLDDSGNNNDWENNGLTESDISLDSPTNNFATWNPLYDFTGSTFQEGNLKTGTTSAGLYGYTTSTIAPSSGKWYCELYCTSSTTSDKVGLGKTTVVLNGTSSTGIINYHRDGGYIQVDGSTQATGSTFGAGDIVGIAADLDSGSATFYKNGVSQGSASFTAVGDYFIGIMQDGRNSLSSNWSANFGQDSSFAGVKTPQGYTDANGIGDFYYAPPAGYLALCTANLPEPAIGPNSATNSDENFNTVLYTGTGSNPRSITGVGFQPDFVWVKDRSSGSVYHLRQDAVRGAEYALDHTTAAEAYQPATGYMSSFDSDGFTSDAGSSSNINFNNNGDAYVAWNWKANGSGVSNTDGSITSTVSANVDAGFSIVSYTGVGSTATVGHGLTQAPEMIIAKTRNVANNWIVYHDTLGGTDKWLALDDTYATLTNTNMWGTALPTSSVFGVGLGNNSNSYNYIAYCFHSVEGYSKFGSYTGNKAVDGPFVYLGFKPAFIMIKSVQYVDNWFVFDSARDDDNIVTATLYPNSSSAETYQSGSSFNPVDFLSNGFKIRGDNGAINDTGAQFIYMAFAENPFKYSNAR